MRVLFCAAVTVFIAAQTLVCSPQSQSSVELRPRAGRALLEWVSDSSFRFCRGWGENSCSARENEDNEEVEVTERDTGTHLEFHTEFLTVVVEKESLRLRVTTAEGLKLLEDAKEVARTAEGIIVERATPVTERFYGLGAHAEPGTNLRGREVAAPKPFLFSSRGYGLHHRAPGDYVFDLAGSSQDSYQILIRKGTSLDFYFHYGPGPKRVLEEHNEVVHSPGALKSWQFGILQRSQLPGGADPLPGVSETSWETLRGSVRSLVNGAMSAILLPAFDLTPYLSAPLPLYRRAMQLGSMAPIVFLSKSILLEPEKLDALDAIAKLRKRLTPLLLAYAREAQTRGLPLIHPLPLQFPRDREAGKVDDAFMLGDEILVAPICEETNRRTVYLPMGFWTDLRTGVRYPGKQTIEVEGALDELPTLARNGSIVPFGPLSESEPMLLHYIPKLAAEFFLFEPEASDYTQLHAGPAGDAMRLEIEAKKAGLYEWVVHHMLPPRGITSSGKAYREVKELRLMAPARWHYDAEKENIHVRVAVGEDKDNVVYITF